MTPAVSIPTTKRLGFATIEERMSMMSLQPERGCLKSTLTVLLCLDPSLDPRQEVHDDAASSQADADALLAEVEVGRMLQF